MSCDPEIHHYAMGVNSSEIDKLYQDDAVWIITSSFIIFTMHSVVTKKVVNPSAQPSEELSLARRSFQSLPNVVNGLVCSNRVVCRQRTKVNIMVKNVVDVVFGGLSYWSVGYGLSYGDYEPFRNSFVGFGRFFYDPT
ncbi:hypothetical protein OSTOST_08438, partial [Ostertagia ostertagi]